MLSFKAWVCAFLLVTVKVVYAQPDDIARKAWLSEELKQNINADEVYSVLAIEAAIVEENYVYAAREALNFIKYHHVNPQIAEIAVDYYYTEGDYEHAYEAVKYWYRVYPDDDNVRTWYTTLLGQTGRDKEFLGVLQQSLHNARPETLKEKLQANALILEELHDTNKALLLFEKMTAPFNFQCADYHILFSDFAARTHQSDLAWKEIFKALDIDKKSEEAALRVLFLSQGDRRVQGLRFVQQFLHQYPQSRTLYLNYVKALVEDGNYTDAIKAIKRMQKHFPEDFDLLYFQALTYYEAQRWADARRVLTQFIDIQQQRQQSLPKNSSTADEKLLDARKLLISIYKIEKKYRLALNELNKIPDIHQEAELLMEKARLLTALGSVKEGLSVLDMASHIFPENRGSFLWLGGNLLNESGRTDEAIVYYNDTLKEFPNNADIKYALAILYDKRSEVWPAEKLLREVIREEPDLADAYNALGYIFAERNYNLEESKELLEKALVLDPDNPYIMDSMGWLQFRLKNYEVALAYLQRAFEEKPEADIAAHLAEVYVAKGNQLKAREVLKVGLQHDANNDVLRDTIKRLNLGVK